MHRNARGLRGDLHRKADAALATGRLVGLATIAFTAVFREGIETTLFMWGIVVQRADLTAVPLLVAGVAGTGLASATAWLFFCGFQAAPAADILPRNARAAAPRSRRAAELGAEQAHRPPPLLPQVWNTSWPLRDDSVLGAVLGAFLGYRSQPSLLEVLAVVAYSPSVLWLLRRADLAARQPQPEAGSA